MSGNFKTIDKKGKLIQANTILSTNPVYKNVYNITNILSTISIQKSVPALQSYE